MGILRQFFFLSMDVCPKEKMSPCGGRTPKSVQRKGVETQGRSLEVKVELPDS